MLITYTVTEYHHKKCVHVYIVKSKNEHSRIHVKHYDFLQLFLYSHALPELKASIFFLPPSLHSFSCIYKQRLQPNQISE